MGLCYVEEYAQLPGRPYPPRLTRRFARTLSTINWIRRKELIYYNGVPVTLQPDVKSVLTQVETGNVDAGMVYVTDVLAAGSKVKGVTIPASDNASTLYPIATISSSKHTSVAQAFMSYVLSPAGQQVLTAAGFQKP